VAVSRSQAAHHRFAMLFVAKEGSGRRDSNLEKKAKKVIQQQVQRRCLREGSRDLCWWWCRVVILWGGS